MKESFKNSRQFGLTALCALALAGCSFGDRWEGTDKAEVPRPPQPDATETAYATVVEPKPQALYEDIQIRNHSDPNPDSGLLQRLETLEQTVAELQGDFAKMAPAFDSLIVTNDRIQAFLDQSGVPELDRTEQQVIQSGQASTPLLPVAATVQEQEQQTPLAALADIEPAAGYPEQDIPAVPPPESVSAPFTPESFVQDVRIGEHPDRTRLVLDISDATEFTYDLDNAEHLLIVQLPHAGWNAAPQSTPPRSPLIAAWSYQPGIAGGTAMAIQLKRDASILQTQTLNPAHGKPTRIVLDVAPLS